LLLKRCCAADDAEMQRAMQHPVALATASDVTDAALVPKIAPLCLSSATRRKNERQRETVGSAMMRGL